MSGLGIGPVQVIDRKTGNLIEEKVHAARFLDWLYNTRSGRVLGPAVVGIAAFSRLYGWWQRRPSSRRRIRRFVAAMNVDLRGSRKSLLEFESFADFFTRELSPDARPLDPDLGTCLAPADSRVLVHPRVERGRPFRIKRCVFDLDGFLRDEEEARRFDGGTLVVCRLSLADYHHVHFPDSGTPGTSRSLAGRYDAGGPYARHRLLPFYSENHRMITPFLAEHFGPMSIVEVGALTVGSIVQHHQPGVRVERGTRKAHFEPGGSTVALLFRQGTIALDADLCAHSARDLETRVLMGQSIGHVPASS